jgi:hypothetical protein
LNPQKKRYFNYIAMMLTTAEAGTKPTAEIDSSFISHMKHIKSESDVSAMTDATESTYDSCCSNNSFSTATTTRRSCLATSASSRRSMSMMMMESSSCSSLSLSVSFGSIEIRDYERVPGDHPETPLGVPLSIGWAYKERRPMSVEGYEKAKLQAEIDSDEFSARRYKSVKRLGAMTRKRLLMDEFHVPLQDILHAERSLEKFKKQLEKMRQEENDNGDCDGKKSIIRSLRKGVLNKLNLRTKKNKSKGSKQKQQPTGSLHIR